MALVYRFSLTGLVWLTAVMTLIAGLPHFDCRCPNGNLKAFCLVSPSSSSGCCGGECCAADKGNASGCCQGPGQKSSEKLGDRACCQQDAKVSQGPTTAAQLGRPHCAKTLAHPEAVSVSATEQKSAKVASWWVDLPPQTVLVSLPELTRCTRSGWQAHRTAPPTDLVTLLQHFVI